MSKAEVVFEKLALSSRTIQNAAHYSKQLVNRLTGSRYKPKSFEEARKVKDLWSRKFNQRTFLTNEANKRYLQEEVKGKTRNFIRVRLP